MADVDVEPLSFLSAPPTPVTTTFTDSFNRPAGELGLDWAVDNLGGNLIAHARIGTLSDGGQGMIVGTLGAGAKSDAYLFYPKGNIPEIYGLDQFCQFDLVSETGTSSFCGPGVAVQVATLLTMYAVIFRNGTWRLSRFQSGTNTDLIAASPLVIPCTLRIECAFNGAVSNLVTVKRNGVQIGQITDISGIIQATGIFGFYLGCPSAGDDSQWRNFSGGAL